MKTQKIISIVTLSLLGLCLLCGLAKITMKKDRHKKNCDKVCAIVIFVAVALVGVGQLLIEPSKLPTPGKPTIRKGLGEKCTVGSFPESGLQANCQKGLVCKSNDNDVTVCQYPTIEPNPPRPPPSQTFDCVKTQYGADNTPVQECQPNTKGNGKYKDKETCQKNCIPYMNTSKKLGMPCKNNTDCKAASGDEYYGDLICNTTNYVGAPATNRCEFKACKDICAKNLPGSQGESECQQTAGGPCSLSQNQGNKNCTNQKWLEAITYTVATADNPKMFPAYMVQPYGSCAMNCDNDTSCCNVGAQIEGVCYNKRITS